MPQQLTTLYNTKEWLGIPQSQTASDALLTRLILRASQAVYSFTQRSSFTPRLIVSEAHDGDYRSRVMLREYPVISISSFLSNLVPVPQAINTNSAGFLVEPWDGYPPGRAQAVDLFGFDTGYGAQATLVTYTAGYQITSEAQTVPSSGPDGVAVNAPFGPWSSDGGVVYASTGVALTAVAGAPTVGQYTVVTTQPGEYQFAAADAGAAVLITYGYIPADVEFAVLCYIGEQDAYRKHLGIRSRNLTGGTGEAVSYTPPGMTEEVRQLLQPYRRVMTG